MLSTVHELGYARATVERTAAAGALVEMVLPHFADGPSPTWCRAIR
jgi:hypothetical protein